MRALIVAVALLMPVVALAQAGSSSGGSSSGGASSGGASSAGSAAGGSAGSGAPSPSSLSPNVSPTRTAPIGSSLAPNVSPTRTTPVTGPSGVRARPDPSPTQAAPVATPVPGPGTGTRDPSLAIGGGVTQRTPQDQARVEQEVREREAREARMRANEERLRGLIRDICTGCDYGTLPRSTGTTVVRAKG